MPTQKELVQELQKRLDELEKKLEKKEVELTEVRSAQALSSLASKHGEELSNDLQTKINRVADLVIRTYQDQV